MTKKNATLEAVKILGPEGTPQDSWIVTSDDGIEVSIFTGKHVDAASDRAAEFARQKYGLIKYVMNAEYGRYFSKGTNL